MNTKSNQTERHEHKGPQCTTHAAVCKNEACVHDHQVSRHVEISCTPVEGKRDTYTCVHGEIAPR